MNFELPEDQKVKLWTFQAQPASVRAGLEFLFQEQSYSSLHSGRSLACDHFRGDIDDPCGIIADFCGVIADFCGVIAYPCGVGEIPEAIVDRCATR